MEGDARRAGRVRRREPPEGRQGASPPAPSRTRSCPTRSTRPRRISRAERSSQRSKVADTDEGPRPDTSMETLAKLKTVFAAQGSVTAGNSSQMSDGAGAVILMSEAALKKYNVKPLARFVSFAVAGVPPEIMGIGPIKAIPKVLSQSGIKVARSRLDRIERGFRRAIARGDPGPRPRSVESEPAGRRDRPRAPARSDGRGAHRDARSRHEARAFAVRNGDHVHRHRHGCRGPFRVAAIRGTITPIAVSRLNQ